MPTITLSNHTLRATIDPDSGASVLDLAVRRGDGWLSLMPAARPGFLMIPYSNRIEGGRFTFDGVSHQLANAETHAIHGDVRRRRWRVAGAGAAHIRCTLALVDAVDRNWPWPFAAEVEYWLQDTLFGSRLTLWNRGTTTMPAGFGWHPFYRRALTQPGEPVRLQMAVTAAYPDAHGNRIPSGPARPLSPAQDFSTERVLAPDQFFDACFRGYDGGGHIAWPESGIRLDFRCSPECTHLVIYNPTDQPYFAVEPVTNANDGVNLPARGEPDSGVVRLPPGERLSATFEQQVCAIA